MALFILYIFSKINSVDVHNIIPLLECWSL